MVYIFVKQSTKGLIMMARFYLPTNTMFLLLLVSLSQCSLLAQGFGGGAGDVAVDSDESGPIPTPKSLVNLVQADLLEFWGNTDWTVSNNPVTHYVSPKTEAHVKIAYVDAFGGGTPVHVAVWDNDGVLLAESDYTANSNVGIVNAGSVGAKNKMLALPFWCEMHVNGVVVFRMKYPEDPAKEGVSVSPVLKQNGNDAVVTTAWNWSEYGPDYGDIDIKTYQRKDFLDPAFQKEVANPFQGNADSSFGFVIVTNFGLKKNQGFELGVPNAKPKDPRFKFRARLWKDANGGAEIVHAKASILW